MEESDGLELDLLVLLIRQLHGYLQTVVSQDVSLAVSLTSQISEHPAKVLLNTSPGVRVNVVEQQLDEAYFNELGEVLVCHLKFVVSVVLGQLLNLLLLQDVRVDPQVGHSTKWLVGLFRVANIADRLQANARLLIHNLVAVKEEPDGSFASRVQVVAHHNDVVPSLLLLSQVETALDHSTSLLADALDLRDVLVDLDVGSGPMDILH